MSAWSVAGPLKSCSQLIKQGKQKKKKSMSLSTMLQPQNRNFLSQDIGLQTEIKWLKSNDCFWKKNTIKTSYEEEKVI